MFPDANHSPTLINENTVRISVTLPIGVDLDTPPFRIRLWHSLMEHATVPKAAVDEDSNALGPEDHIRRSPETGNWLLMNPIAQAPAVEKLAQLHLDTGVE